MKTTNKYCSLCKGQTLTRHKNPGNICDPCWLSIQQDDIELTLWQSAITMKKQKEKQLWTGK